MPYKLRGRSILHKKGGKWKTKQKARSTASAKRAMRLLRGIEHGWRPTGKPAKRLKGVRKRKR